ncbi:L,D-transpeptidase family protein [Modestobacter versicolor]|uniref:L,D-transpeptidase family protein n=1 Tax=Modestobacter versicolor TaxID=429133 RepID=UPI0034DF7C4B
MVIDHNRGGTPGAGSAFFLHVTDGAPTAGCVAVDRAAMQQLLRWLDPAATPVISIGVG